MFGAFGLVVLDLRQQASVLRTQNHPNIARRNVRSSFFIADFLPDEALSAGNTLCIPKVNNEVWGDNPPEKTDMCSTAVGLNTLPQSRRFLSAYRKTVRGAGL